MKAVFQAASAVGLVLTGGAAIRHQLSSSHRTAYADYIEPKTGIRFPEKVTGMTNPEGRKLESVEMQLVQAGVRCMLGNSVLCDRVPDTRVFSFGLYSNPVTNPQRTERSEDPNSRRKRSKVFKKGKNLNNAPNFKKTMLKMEDNTDPRCLRMIPAVPKHGLHWARGFHKVLDKRLKCPTRMPEMRNPDRTFKRERMDNAQEALRKFCEVFAWEGMIAAGTEFLFTWSPGVLIIQMDGKVIKVLHNEDVARAMFLTYFGVKSVNRDVTHKIIKQWKRREVYNDWIPYDNTDEFPDERSLFSKETAPDCDMCSLHGFQLHGEYKDTDYSIITEGTGGTVGLPGKKYTKGTGGGHI